MARARALSSVRASAYTGLMPLNLVKLCIGAESLEGQQSWTKERVAQMRAAGGEVQLFHTTRMVPKAMDELLDGGSLYWVIKGQIQARQKILRLDEVIGEDGIRRCAIVLDPEMHRTETAPKRPFQGWRYLKPGDAPRDLSHARTTDTPLPLELTQALAEIGVR